MGQYYKIVDLDKRQYLHPHMFGDGLKLLEFGDSSSGAMLGLAVLLASGNGLGGGDLHSDAPIVGSWAGDRIVIAGDYGDKGLYVDDPEKNLYDVAEEEYEDVSEEVIVALAADSWVRQALRESLDRFSFGMGKNLSQETQDLLRTGTVPEKESRPSPIRPDMVLVAGEKSNA